jgi:hypothetical protein
LQVNGVEYSGTAGPQGVVPTQDITWSAAPWLQGRRLTVVAGHLPGACCRRAIAYHAVARISSCRPAAGKSAPERPAARDFLACSASAGCLSNTQNPSPVCFRAGGPLARLARKSQPA